MSTTAQTKPKKSTTTSKKPLSHPTFAEMITEAIVSLKERTGSSQYAITKFIEEKHKELPPTYRKLILVHLKKSVASGKFVKVKNSFKLASPPAKTAPVKTAPAKAKVKTTVAAKKPKAVTKTVAKATTTKPKAKAASKPKAKAASKPKAVVKPKAKTVKSTPVKKAVKKVPVKKVKSVKTPVKKAKK